MTTIYDIFLQLAEFVVGDITTWPVGLQSFFNLFIAFCGMLMVFLIVALPLRLAWKMVF